MKGSGFGYELPNTCIRSGGWGKGEKELKEKALHFHESSKLRNTCLDDKIQAEFIKGRQKLKQKFLDEENMDL